MANESVPHTNRHISLVRDLLYQFAVDVAARGDVHDKSKFDPVEQGPLDELQRLTDAEGPAAYGTPEYERRKTLLAPMIAHHHAVNSHHPEFYRPGHPDGTGIAGMDLLDLVEMFLDWRAANVDRDGGAPMNLSYSIQKHGIPPMLESIFRNTAKRHGWAVK